jgi:rhamnogalacturonyl hydrolase YesR
MFLHYRNYKYIPVIHNRFKADCFLFFIIVILLSCSPNNRDLSLKNGNSTYSVRIGSNTQNMPSGGIITSEYSDSPAGQEVDKLLDHNVKTKFSTFHNQFYLIWRGDQSELVDHYSLASSDGSSRNDPAFWTLYGSADSIKWISLDNRIDSFPLRLETKTYTIPNASYYSYYKLEVRKNNGGDQTQFSEWALKTASDQTTFFLSRADTLWNSFFKLYWSISGALRWHGAYPISDGYWNGDAVVWGQGGGLAAFLSMREATSNSQYGDDLQAYDNTMFDGINNFITNDNGIAAYAVYPASGNDRYYDDNAWIGLDMIKWYNLTKDDRYLEKAKMVWKYLMKGNTPTCGGGILWKEYPSPTPAKHTCSTAPTAVLGCRLFMATGDSLYLNKAKELYAWLQNYLQDPIDHLYWDNIDPDMKISTSKYSYNSGEPMEAAALLYKITKESKYLTDAQEIAQSAYDRWFTSFHSNILNDDFRILSPGSCWFNAVMFRGYLALYDIDNNRTYLDALQKTMKHAWLSNCRNKDTNLLNDGDLSGEQLQTSWEMLQQSACVELMADLAQLEKNER